MGYKPDDVERLIQETRETAATKRRRRLIVVLDTNVWISALEFGGVPDRAVFRALTQNQLAISSFITDETARVLTTKFARNPAELKAQLDELLAWTSSVEITGEVKGVCRDPMMMRFSKRPGQQTPPVWSPAIRICSTSASSGASSSFRPLLTSSIAE